MGVFQVRHMMTKVLVLSGMHFQTIVFMKLMQDQQAVEDNREVHQEIHCNPILEDLITTSVINTYSRQMPVMMDLHVSHRTADGAYFLHSQQHGEYHKRAFSKMQKIQCPG